LSRGTIKRRRREKKTDYKQRLKLLKSGHPRLVVRKTSNNTIVQIIEWKREGDNVLHHAEAQELKKMGWKGHTGNLPAAYLTGYLLGRRAQKSSIENPVLDIGLQKNTPGNRIYSAVLGVLDSGLNVPAGEEMLPSKKRVQGKHIEEYAAEMDEDRRQEHFSKMFDNGLDPQNISENFEEVKEKIESEVK